MTRLGFGYDDVATIHPSVVYVSVSGFGNLVPTPYADWAAYASIAEAMSSLYDFKRDPEVPPVTSPMGALGDTGTALFATIGVLAALRHRDRTGEGAVDRDALEGLAARPGRDAAALRLDADEVGPGGGDTDRSGAASQYARGANPSSASESRSR